VEFTNLQSAMMILGFSNTELKAIYAVLAAIIHLSHTKIVKKGDKFNKSKMNNLYLLHLYCMFLSR